MAEFELLASAAFGMEAIVVRELADLGYANARVDDGRVRFRGDLAAICRTNLWLRCAERVQVVVAEFPARNFDDLFDQIKVLPWEDWLPVDAKFPVTARCVRSDIRSVPNTQKMVKRAIVERLRKVYSRHWFAETGVQYDIEAIILGDRALMTIDTTGEGLHKRGYRNLVGRAPLRETVAAAMVKLSYWNRDRLLVDPFCGSGTIPIEAALIGRNLAPGRNRSFSAEQWGQIPRATWSAARQEVKDLENRQPLGIPIVATDRDRSAIRMATQHARQAGVQTEIHFEEKDFVAFPTHRDAGILICNPPYGERLGEEEEVRQLYRDMGELLRPLDDWSLYILTGAEGFEREFGKQADRRRKLYNARIACTFYQYLGPKPVGTASTEEQPVTEAEQVRQPQPEKPFSQQGSAGRNAPWERPRADVPVESKPEGEVRQAAPDRPRSEEVREEPARSPLPSNNPWANARRPQPSPSPPSQRTTERDEPVAPVPRDEKIWRREAAKPISAEEPSNAQPAAESAARHEDVPVPAFEVPTPTAGFPESVTPTQSMPESETRETAPQTSETPAATSPAPPLTEPPTVGETPEKPHPWKKNPWPRR